MRILFLKKTISYRKASSQSEPVTIYEIGSIIPVIEKGLGVNNTIWFKINDNEWVLDNKNVYVLENDIKTNASLNTLLLEYNYVMKKDDKTIFLTKANIPFQDDDNIDEYSLYKYDRIDIPENIWIKVKDIV